MRQNFFLLFHRRTFLSLYLFFSLQKKEAETKRKRKVMSKKYYIEFCIRITCLVVYLPWQLFSAGAETYYFKFQGGHMPHGSARLWPDPWDCNTCSHKYYTIIPIHLYTFLTKIIPPFQWFHVWKNVSGGNYQELLTQFFINHKLINLKYSNISYFLANF